MRYLVFLILLLLVGCAPAPPEEPKTQTWSAPTNPITITGPGTVDPGGTHTFTLNADGEAGKMVPFSVRIFGGGEVTSLAGSPPKSSAKEMQFQYFEGPDVKYDANGKYSGEVTIKVADSPFVPLFSRQGAKKTVPLGLHIEFTLGNKTQEAEARARGVADVQPQ